MKRWADLSTEARDAVIRQEFIDVGMFWGAWVFATIAAAIYQWSST